MKSSFLLNSLSTKSGEPQIARLRRENLALVDKSLRSWYE
jgi:hypothetical protein